MGTLTAGCPRLESHCPHKLPTSCRLTATPKCCACADHRPHSRLYRVYIDGVGFVQRGTRWQSYCWFCKEFWNNRLLATDPPLQASDTQIPAIPDQTEYLSRWWEFHQGYRLVSQADGAEDRIAVLGEPLEDVSPGFLPRTIEQLREGRLNDASRPENRTTRSITAVQVQHREEPQETMDELLDSLMAEVSDHEDENSQQPTAQLLPPSRQIDASASQSRSEARLERARERLVRVFGTRDDVQSDDYVSPLSTMYDRAWNRYQQAEERRASGITLRQAIDSAPLSERRELENQLLWAAMEESGRSANARPTAPNDRLDIMLPSSSRDRNDIAQSAGEGSSANAAQPPPPSQLHRPSHRSRFYTPNTPWELQYQPNPLPNPLNPNLTLDTPDRPPPLTEAQMVKKLACSVCYSQLADTVVLPCGHMVMCQWCADIVVPVRHNHIPALPSKCPMCRKGVKQRWKVHVGS